MISSPPLLIDSSAWIEVLRNRASAELQRTVADSLAAGTAAMTEPVWIELWQGVRGKQELSRLQSLRGLCRWLSFDSCCWDQACGIARTCSTSGIQVPLGDILVAACTRHHKARLLHRDRHFQLIDKALS